MQTEIVKLSTRELIRVKFSSISKGIITCRLDKITAGIGQRISRAEMVSEEIFDIATVN